MMGNERDFIKNGRPKEGKIIEAIQEQAESILPTMDELKTQLAEASKLVDDIILKKYLYKLTDLEIIPLEDSFKQISKIRLFKITEMVYQKDEYSTYKLASAFSSLQNLNSGIFIIVDGSEEKTEFYMGVRSFDERSPYSFKNTLENALSGHFPGVKTKNLFEPEIKELLEEIPAANIASVSCVANNKNEDFKDNNTFIQGLEKLALAMQGKEYTAIVLAKSTPPEQIEEMRKSYETIYTQLSPFANMQLSYGTNTALSISDALSHGTTTGTSYTRNTGTSIGDSISEGKSQNESVSKPDSLGASLKIAGIAALGTLSMGVAAAPLSAGASLAVAGAVTIGQVCLSAFAPPQKSTGTTTSETCTRNNTYTEGESWGKNESASETNTFTKGLTSGKNENMQLTMQNKTLLNTLDRIDQQLKRLDECESLGMWECAAYFLSEHQETAEMAAGTYKALMKGAKSGVETSAINYWRERENKEKLSILRDYITNFIHPVFAYATNQNVVPVTASSLVSSNELAIQMGLPRKAVCGFPVVEHADFGKEVVSYDKVQNRRELCLGKIFTMGTETKTAVNLDIDSLTMHTFVTGSTGSGKSNTVYKILEQLHKKVPFLVVEPAKGEYKNVFGQEKDVSVYGTNPKKMPLLKINPFSFPEDVHILEHLDRLVEIFNVCWPMYAAMPAILKDAVERAYVSTGWDLVASENKAGNMYPNFMDVLEQIQAVINESQYSLDSKGDYAGALLTRVRSLTTGLNGLIFCNESIAEEDLFDKSVIVDLSRVGSTETKSLIMGLLVMKLNEYRMSSGKINSALSHITVLEEAHNLLKRTSTEQSSESSNLLGKSVELLTNSIAEMRTYGEGFIIADQSPGLLDMSVIRNTNTKIILRLPERSDRELVGYAAGLKEEQLDELAKLKRGVAAVYQNDWIEPVLVQVAKCEQKETAYTFSPEAFGYENINVLEQILNLLIHGKTHEKYVFPVEDIERSIEKHVLSGTNAAFVKEQLAEYKAHHSLSLWSPEKFGVLSKYIIDILGVRAKIENSVLSASDNKDLTEKLQQIAHTTLPDASKAKTMVLCRCFMKDMSTRPDEKNDRQRIYKNWLYYLKNGGAL